MCNTDIKSIIGMGLLAISTITIIIFLFHKNEPFFNLRDITVMHLRLFEKSTIHYIIFYFIPLLFAVGLSLLYSAGLSFYSELNVVVGIILSILLAILAIIGVFDFSKVLDRGQKERSRKVLNETINTIVFTCILCLFLLLYSLIIVVASGAYLPWLPISRSTLKGIAAGIAYYSFSVVLLHLLLVVKQMCKLIQFNQYANKE